MEIISEQVKKFIGNKEILKGINIDVKNKEFLGIIGPNGSGKLQIFIHITVRFYLMEKI